MSLTLAGGPALPVAPQEPVGERKPRCPPPSPPAAGELVSAGCGHHMGVSESGQGVLRESPHRELTQDAPRGAISGFLPTSEG